MTRPLAADAGATAAKVGRVDLKILREGEGTPLFLVPGLGCAPEELRALAEALAAKEGTIGIAIDTDARFASVEEMAALAIVRVRSRQPNGPYRLGGYSFGALVAFEMAGQLIAAGESIEHLFLIEPALDESHWPRNIWLRALARRSAVQISRIATMRPAAASAELALRTRRLAARFRSRAGGGVTGTTPIRRLFGRYRPGPYTQKIVLIAAIHDRHFGVDPAALWRGLVQNVSLRRIEADHLSILRDPDSVAAVAAVIDHEIALGDGRWPGLRPMTGFQRPMLVTTMRWFSTARLGQALEEAGFAVSACRPPRHPLEDVEGIDAQFPLSRSTPLRDLRTAIARAGPDLIVPDDEHAIRLLGKLAERARMQDPAMAALIDRSLRIMSRSDLAATAESLGIATPRTRAIDCREVVDDSASREGLPLVLKTDGSWGGRGVAIIRDRESIAEIWRSIAQPPPLWRALKRMIVDRDNLSFVQWARQSGPAINLQSFVVGRPAIVTGASLDGRLLGLVCMEVEESASATGPATVVRIIEHAGMSNTATRLIAELGLSGFSGFDFMLRPDGEAILIEMNARATPTAHLLLEGFQASGAMLALFPQSVMTPHVRPIATLDLPVRAPILTRRGLAMVGREQRPSVRVAHALRDWLAVKRFQ